MRYNNETSVFLYSLTGLRHENDEHMKLEADLTCSFIIEITDLCMGIERRLLLVRIARTKINNASDFVNSEKVLKV